MLTFAEIESKHQRTVLHGIVGDIQTHGVLTLGGESAELKLSSTGMLPYPKGHSGWFDLELKNGENESVLLHKALFRNWGHQARDGRRSESIIFPNIVVFNAEALGKHQTIRSISFTAPLLSYFFWHEAIEHHIDDGPILAQFVRSKRRAGSRRTSYPRALRDYDYNAPSSVYVVHKPRRILAFRALGRKHEIWRGSHQRGLGWTRLELQSFPVGSISFERPSSIDDALRATFDWLHFFSQIAFQRLVPDSLTATGQRRKRWPNADIYLSYLRGKEPRTVEDGHFSARDVALCEWKHRNDMAEAMRRWLGVSSDRRAFRSTLEELLHQSGGTSPLPDVVSICGAIEALELAPMADRSLPKRTVAAMARAASEAATAANANVSQTRVRSLLEMLGRPPLSSHLRKLLSVVMPSMTEESIRLVLANTSTVRNMAAHGGSEQEMTIPLAVHVRQFWLAAAILYDLSDAGYPTSRTVAAQRADWSLSQLQRISQRSI